MMVSVEVPVFVRMVDLSAMHWQPALMTFLHSNNSRLGSTVTPVAGDAHVRVAVLFNVPALPEADAVIVMGPPSSRQIATP